MPEKIKIIIAGAGGHGKVVADAVLKEGKYEIAGFADDTKTPGTIVFMNYKVLCAIQLQEVKKQASHFIVAIGDNSIRKRIFLEFSKEINPVTVIHPFVSLAEVIQLGAGSVILAGAVINTSSVIGENCIINSSALVDHDVSIGAHTHIGQGALIGSGNIIGDLNYIQQGQNIKSIFHP
ncbi:MAG: hypothetical protein ACOZCO_11725 [Bacteroidota bacterium]